MFILLKFEVRFRFTGCDSRLLWCSKRYQALRVPALHVNGPTSAELEGILSAAPPYASDTGQQEKAVLAGAIGMSCVLCSAACDALPMGA